MEKRKQPSDTKKSMCRRIQCLLDERGHNSSWLANKTGYSKQAISEWLNPNKTNEPNASAILKIADALDTHPDYLLGVSRSGDLSQVVQELRKDIGLSDKAIRNLNRLTNQARNEPVFTPESLFGIEDIGVWAIRATPAYIGSPLWTLSTLIEDEEFILLAHAFLTSERNRTKGRLQDVEAYGILHLLDEKLIEIRKSKLDEVEKALSDEKLEGAFQDGVKEMTFDIQLDTGETLGEFIAKDQGFDSFESYLQALDAAYKKAEGKGGGDGKN